MQPTRWRISLHGKLAVFRPDGEPVRFKTRKVGAILAMLALEKGAPLQRSEIGAALWPGIDRSEQLMNVRQALRLLRSALGERAPLECNRQSCWLLVDMVTVEAGESQLLPEMVESWFDSYRPYDELDEPVRHEANSAEGFLTVLGWAARYRPREGLALVRDFPDLAEMADPGRLSGLLEKCISVVSPDDPLYGWGMALRAVGNALSGNIEDAIRSLHGAREYSTLQDDADLGVFSAFYLSVCLVLSGRTRELRRLLESTKGVRAKGVSQVRLRHGRGLCLIHLGDFDEGLAELRFARDLLDPVVAPYEHAYVLSNLALFEATNGSIVDAEGALSELKQSIGYGCARLNLTGLLSDAILTARRGEIQAAERMLKNLEYASTKYELSGHRQYALEHLAVLQQQVGRKAEAMASWSMAQAVRAANGYSQTAWDRLRLRPLLRS